MIAYVIVFGYIVVSFIVFNLLRHIVQSDGGRFDSYDALICTIYALGWPFTVLAMGVGRYIGGPR